MFINRTKFIFTTILILINFVANAENYLCEVKSSGGIKYDKTNKIWTGTSFQVSEYTKQFSITKVTKSDYKDDTFELYDKVNSTPAKILKPKYKIKTIYKTVSKVFKVCENGFNQYGYLNCANGDIIFNKNNMRFQRNVFGSYILDSDCDKQICSDSVIDIGTCSRL